MAIFTDRTAWSAGCLVLDPGGNGPEVAHQSDEGQQTECIVSQVDFALEEALAGGTGKKVMVIVPTFTESEKSEPEVILAFVFRVISTGAEQMGDGINRKGGVVKDNGGNEEAPNQGGPARQSGKGLKPGGFTEEVATKGKGKDGNPIKAVDEA